MIRLLIKIFSWINNFSYKTLSFLAIKENAGIHPKHQILSYHQFFLKNIHEADSVLDIGCGNGACAFDLAHKAREVVGIDIDQKNIQTAQKKFSRKNVTYIVGDATTKNFGRQFDSIVLSNVLEHIENRTGFLKKIKGLAPKILVRVPLITRDWLAVYKKKNGLNYRLDPTHFVEYTEEGFEKEIAESDLEIESQHVKFGELYAILRKKHE